MRKLGVVVALVLVSVLAGCVDGPGAGEAPSSLDPSPAGPMDLKTDVDGCIEVLLLALVDPAHARTFLPPGFEPADAAAFFGVPAPADRAMVAINAIQCEFSVLENGPTGSGELVVLVEPPEVHGAEVETALRNAYNVHQYVAGSGLVAATNGTGFEVSKVSIEAVFEPAPDGQALAGTGVLADDEGELARFEVTAAPGPRDTATSNQFQVTPTGLVVHAYQWAEGAASAGAATCSVRAGSLIAEVLGTTTCDDADTVGLLFGPVDFDGRLRYLPGAGVMER